MSNLRVMSLIYDLTVWVYGVIIIVEGFVPIPESKAVRIIIILSAGNLLDVLPLHYFQ